MKKFLIILKNNKEEIICFKTKAETKTQLFYPNKSPTQYLLNKMIKDSYLFKNYNIEQMKECKIIFIEELKFILEI